MTATKKGQVIDPTLIGFYGACYFTWRIQRGGFRG